MSEQSEGLSYEQKQRLGLRLTSEGFHPAHFIETLVETGMTTEDSRAVIYDLTHQGMAELDDRFVPVLTERGEDYKEALPTNEAMDEVVAAGIQLEQAKQRLRELGRQLVRTLDVSPETI